MFFFNVRFVRGCDFWYLSWSSLGDRANLGIQEEEQKAAEDKTFRLVLFISVSMHIALWNSLLNKIYS